MMKKLGDLHFQGIFKGLVPFSVLYPQGVKYAGPTILMIDDKCNPMALEARAAPLKQNIGYDDEKA
jgi:hypothetical protein